MTASSLRFSQIVAFILLATYDHASSATFSFQERLNPPVRTSEELLSWLRDPKRPKVRLLPLPKIDPPAEPLITPSETKHIEDLIRQLSQVTEPDYDGLSWATSGHSFVPVPNWGEMSSGIVTNHGIKQNSAVLELVKLGPRALPQLLKLSDISVPVLEVRDYIMSKYEARFSIHPKLFEDTVASVFKDHGFSVIVTGHSHDGGIDVILTGKDNQEIGVQVKRYKNAIQVEQIRSLAGALVLRNLTDGIFVTTSRFSSVAVKTSEEYQTARIPIRIELLDGNRFYDALKLAQRTVERTVDGATIDHWCGSMVLISRSNYEVTGEC